MSGINPLIDTLLHDVLGRRVGRKNATETKPVGPTEFAQALRPVQSDSRTDSRTALPWALTQSLPSSSSAHMTSDRALQARSEASLSETAQLISKAFERLQGAAVLKIAGILLSEDKVTARDLTLALEKTIRDSGLFYESKLFQWHRGQLSELALKSQMQIKAQQGQGLEARDSQAVPREASILTPAQIAAMPGARAELLQVIVHHQLELLFAPAIRWEGYLWEGVYAALMLQFPESIYQGIADDPSQTEHAADNKIRAILKLTIAELGNMCADIALSGSCVEVNLYTVEADLYDLIKSEHASLSAMIRQAELGEPAIRVLYGRGPADVR